MILGGGADVSIFDQHVAGIDRHALGCDGQLQGRDRSFAAEPQDGKRILFVVDGGKGADGEGAGGLDGDAAR